MFMARVRFRIQDTLSSRALGLMAECSPEQMYLAYKVRVMIKFMIRVRVRAAKPKKPKSREKKIWRVK